jgi:hypothetical protein
MLEINFVAAWQSQNSHMFLIMWIGVFGKMLISPYGMVSFSLW